MSNLEEFLAGSSPVSVDTDHDGMPDGDDPDYVIPQSARQVVLDPIFTYLGGN